MADCYRLTIRTDERTADTFRELAYQESLTLGEMLNTLIRTWHGRLDSEEICSRLLALKYGSRG